MKTKNVFGSFAMAAPGRVRKGVMVVLAVVSSAMTSGCGEAPAAVDHPLAVRVTQVRLEHDAMSGLVLSGTVVPRVESQMAFRVSGRIVERPVDVGAQVKAGAMLVRLDEVPFRLAVDEAEALLAQEQGTLGRVERDVQRHRSLVESGAIARADFDALETLQSTARAGVQAARSRLQQARNNLIYSTLSAPVEVTVAAVHAEVGQVVQSGMPIMQVAFSGRREVQMDVPEVQVAAIAVGQSVSVSLLSSASEVLEGKVREIAPMADPATRTFRVRVTLDSLPASARLGMTAAVQINSLISQPHVRLPLTALFQKDRQPAVWVLAPGSEHVRLRSVKVGVLATDTFSVIDGLVPGEEVVTAGVHRLDEQQKVQVWGGRLP